MAKFDNLDDVQGKFISTICYFDKKPILIKDAQYHPDFGDQYILIGSFLGSKAPKSFDVHDELFDYKNYNLGYANAGELSVWWFRKPLRQYRQGLKVDQLGYTVYGYKPGVHDISFNFSKPFVKMLSNDYPSINECVELVGSQERHSCAFHKDFALSLDNVHQDFILEYRGKPVGHTGGLNSKSFNLMDNAKYLKESLQEALG